MLAEEGLDDVVEELAVQVEVEHGEEAGVERGQAAQCDGERIFFTLASLLTSSCESSNSSSEGSSGSSCMTVNI